MSRLLFVPSIVLSRFSNSLIDFLLFFLPPFRSRAEGTMNDVVNPLHGISVSYCLSHGPLFLFSKVLPPPKLDKQLVLHYQRAAVVGGTGIAYLSQSALLAGYNGLCFQG